MPTKLSVAVCVYANVDALDYQGPIDLFGFVDSSNPGGIEPPPQYSLEVQYISSNLDPVKPFSGPRIVPDATFKEIIAKNHQFDILLVPGGPGMRPGKCPEDLLEFIRVQAPEAKYILSVCTGGWVLGMSGILNGKKATTNKKAFKECKKQTDPSITWVAPARWVQDGNIWTSSGVTAGLDMAAAFLSFLVGEEFTTGIRNIVELRKHDQYDDEFAEIWGDVEHCKS